MKVEPSLIGMATRRVGEGGIFPRPRPCCGEGFPPRPRRGSIPRRGPEFPPHSLQFFFFCFFLGGCPINILCNMCCIWISNYSHYKPNKITNQRKSQTLKSKLHIIKLSKFNKLHNQRPKFNTQQSNQASKLQPHKIKSKDEKLRFEKISPSSWMHDFNHQTLHQL